MPQVVVGPCECCGSGTSFHTCVRCGSTIRLKSSYNFALSGLVPNGFGGQTDCSGLDVAVDVPTSTEVNFCGGSATGLSEGYEECPAVGGSTGTFVQEVSWAIVETTDAYLNHDGGVCIAAPAEGSCNVLLVVHVTFAGTSGGGDIDLVGLLITDPPDPWTFTGGTANCLISDAAESEIGGCCKAENGTTQVILS